MWPALDMAAVELDRDAGHAVAALGALEEALRRRSLHERVRAILAGAASDS